MDTKDRICIVGAGLVGSLLSILLANRGFKVDLIEKRCDLRIANIPGGRTIAMSLSKRGWNALGKVGMVKAVEEIAVPKFARMVHLGNNSCLKQQYGKTGDAISTINRKTLNRMLLDKAEKTGKVQVEFKKKCTGLDMEQNRIELLNLETGEKEFRLYDRIIGADGIFSSVAKKLSEEKLVDQYLFSPAYGYKEFVIPSDKEGNYKFRSNVVHVWPRKNFCLVSLPNIDHTFTCTLFLRFHGKYSLYTLTRPELVEQFFEENFPNVIDAVPDYREQFLTNPISNIYSQKCFPWNYKNKILLIGDAAHAIAPFFAMGMNLGFEDCAVFDDLMTQHKNNLDDVFEAYTLTRKADTDAIADLSLKNFTALGRSDDPYYHLKWELSRRFWKLHPREWIPLYPMIAFSTIRLSEVKHLSEIQAEILDVIFRNEKAESILEQDAAEIYNKYAQGIYLKAAV